MPTVDLRATLHEYLDSQLDAPVHIGEPDSDIEPEYTFYYPADEHDWPNLLDSIEPGTVYPFVDSDGNRIGTATVGEREPNGSRYGIVRSESLRWTNHFGIDGLSVSVDPGFGGRLVAGHGSADDVRPEEGPEVSDDKKPEVDLVVFGVDTGEEPAPEPERKGGTIDKPKGSSWLKE